LFFILHGEDEYRKNKELERLVAEAVGKGSADFNVVRLNGSKTTLNEIKNSCETLPMLANRRVVIIEDLTAFFKRRKFKDEPEQEDKDEAGQENRAETRGKHKDEAKILLQFLAELPETTDLIAKEGVIADEKKRARSPLLKLGKVAKIKQFSSLGETALHQWIESEVKSRGGQIHSKAIRLLAEHVGHDLGVLGQEIEKLCTYRGAQIIRSEDVEQMVPYLKEASVFVFVDSLGRRQTRSAMELLHKLLDEGESPYSLFGMIIRQFRILLGVKILASKGDKREAIVSSLGLNPYVVEKALAQIRNFSIEELYEIYRQLGEIDGAIKRGLISPLLALEILTVRLSQKPLT